MAKLHFRPYIPNQTVLFPQRIDENIAANDPVRIVNTVVDNLNLDLFKKLYKDNGRCPYHPKMMLKVILYAYMNNIYSCRKIEKLLLRDIHYIWLSGNEHPDFITINRFRNIRYKVLRYGKVTFSSLQSHPNRSFTTKN